MRSVFLALLLCGCVEGNHSSPLDSDTSPDVGSEAGTDTDTDSDTTVEPAPIGLAIELTWSLDINGPLVGDDLDLHLILGDAPVGDPVFDCYWGNAQPNWGALADGSDDPDLTRDDTSGTGPERVEMPVAQDQSYRVVIVDSAGNGVGSEDANDATVVIWVNDVETYRSTTTLTGDASQTEVVVFNPVEATYVSP